MATNGTQLFNGGNPSVGPQLTEFDMTRVAVREARRKRPFSQMAKLQKIKRNHGDTFKKERKYPVLHKANINTMGVDPEGLQLLPTKWYAWDANRVRTEHATKAAALASAGQVSIMSGQGNLYGGSKDFAEQTGSIPELRETGGRVNVVGGKRVILTGKIKLYSLSEEFSRTEMELGGEERLKAEKSMELGEAYADLRETMLRNDLLSQAMTAPVFAGTALAINQVDETSIVTYDTLRRFQSKLDLLRVPMATRMITGSTKVGTKVVESARYYHIPLELERTIEEIKHDGKSMFKFVSEYAGSTVGIADRDQDINAANGEIGAIGKARFISDSNMGYFQGSGADATDGTDANANNIEDAGENLSITDGKYDVFPILSVGAESFEVLGLEGDDVSVKYASPRIIPGLDNTGELGVVSIRFWYGVLFNKIEHVNCILTSGLK